MKAIIEVTSRNSVFDAALADLSTANPDFHLSFESARSLFAEVTPARLDLLSVLHRIGPCSVYALAKAAGRNYSNVHADVVKLTELKLIDRTDDDAIYVPFEEIEIRMALSQAA